MHARAAVKFVQTANSFKSRGEGRQGRSGGERQEHHGPADAGGGARRDDDRRLRRRRRGGGGRGAGRAGRRRASARGSIRDGESWSASARRPGSPSASRTCSASRVDIHERRIAADAGRGRAARASSAALAETDAQLARIQAADRRARGRRAAVPHPRGAPPDAVRRPPGRARAPADPRRQRRRRVGGAQGAGPDPGGVRAHRGSVLPRAQERRRARRRAPAAQPARASATRRRPRRRPRGASPSRTSCRPPTPRSWAAPRRRASAPRAAAARRTRRSWRARWACRYVVGVEKLGHQVWSGMTVVIDGARGEVILDPDAEALRALRGARRRAAARARSGWRRCATSPSQTIDGTPIHLHANIEMLEEIPIAVELGAEAVGLFRTEFLYLERADLPSEDEQYAHAVAALKSVGGRHGHLPHARSRRRQAAAVGAHPERHQPGDGAALDPLFAQARGRVPHPAARAVPRRRRSGRCRSCFR